MIYYKWRKKYGGLRVVQANRLKELEHEISRLRKVVADQTIDIWILKDAAWENFKVRIINAGQSERYRKKQDIQKEGCARCLSNPGQRRDLIQSFQI
jgi:hypothetical protein